MTKSRNIRSPRWRIDAGEISILREFYPNVPTRIIAVALGRSAAQVHRAARGIGLTKSAAYLASPAACRLRRGDGVGSATRFPKGHVPANKGLRRPGYAPGRMAETQFRKGTPPRGWMPIGSTRLIDGYQYTKTSDIRNVAHTRNWRPTHVLLWEKHHGPVPPKHALVFANGDRTDIRLDNLTCIHRRELMARNTVHNLPPALVEVVQLRGRLNRQINKRKCGHEKRDR